MWQLGGAIAPSTDPHRLETVFSPYPSLPLALSLQLSFSLSLSFSFLHPLLLLRRPNQCSVRFHQHPSLAMGPSQSGARGKVQRRERERERETRPSFLPFRGTDLQLASIFSKCPYCPLSVPLSSPRDLSRVTTSNEGLSYTVY